MIPKLYKLSSGAKAMSGVVLVEKIWEADATTPKIKSYNVRVDEKTLLLWEAAGEVVARGCCWISDLQWAVDKKL